MYVFYLVASRDKVLQASQSGFDFLSSNLIQNNALLQFNFSWRHTKDPYFGGK